MDPNQQQLLLTGGAKDSTYVDDVFHIQVHLGTGVARSIDNGIDLAGEGGLLWARTRDKSFDHTLFDTVRSNGRTTYLSTNLSNVPAGYNGSGITSFNNNGYSLGTDTQWGGLNHSGQGYGTYEHVINTFRKAKGFFDIVTYTGSGAGGGQQVAHNLGCVPGMIIIKRLDQSASWAVYHRGYNNGVNPWDYRAYLNSPNAVGNNNHFNDTAPTSTHFSVGGSHTETSVTGGEYVAYLFAGGPSSAATARSVDLDGAGDALITNASTDYSFGTGDFTVEHWIYPRDVSYVQQTLDTRTASYNNNNQWCTYIDTDGKYKFFMGGDRINSDYSLVRNQWHHIAITRNSGRTYMFINGVQQTSIWSDSTNYSSDKMTFGGHGPDPSNYSVDAIYSQVRVVKGQAVYTGCFIPPKEPLTTTSQGATASNVKLLCCQNTTPTGSTVGTVVAHTAGNTNPTATTVNPFDDPEGFNFGEQGDQNIVKCGTYKGNGTANSLFIDCGWEPQWLLIKKASSAENWLMLDCMRGISNRGGNVGDKYITANQSSQEAEYDFVSLTPTGFKLTVVEGHTNSTNEDYIYLAIRRPDGYVGKPAELGTDVFAIDQRNTNQQAQPAFDANFSPDFTWLKKPTVTEDWFVNSKSRWSQYLLMNERNAVTNTTYMTYDYGKGMGNAGLDATYWTWMWKRHAGFDVVSTEPGTGSGMNIRHSLGKVPEMIWTKKINTSNWPSNSGDGYILDNWFVWHKDYDPTNNVGYLNKATAGGYAMVKPQDGGATSVSTAFHSNITYTNDENLMMFFASVDGICKVGSYTGSASGQTITTGFQPRFVIIKSTTAGRNWVTLDTVRGWGAGNDQELNLNTGQNQNNSYDFGAPTATGFTVTTAGSDVNASGHTYIYYAHA